jgi:hypothetical protein
MQSSPVFSNHTKRDRKMDWDLNPFCVKWFLLTWSTRNSLVISLREDPIPCTVAPWWDIGLMGLGRSIGELTWEIWRMMGVGGMQTTMSLNCNSQRMTFILSDAIIISYSKIYSDGSKRKALNKWTIRIQDEFHISSKFHLHMEPRTSISCSKEPATESYFEPVESSPHFIPLRYILTVGIEVSRVISSIQYFRLKFVLYAFLTSPMYAICSVHPINLICSLLELSDNQ